jgi:probable DNA repair protein
MEGDRQLAPSPLLIDLPERSPDSLDNAAPPRHVELINREVRAETWSDDRAPILEKTEAPGGTRLFRLQSACPFRAFAEVRLQAAALPTQEIGLDVSERGTLVHRALERLWATLSDQQTLAALDPPARADRIRTALDEVIAHAARRRPFTFTERFRELERERLTILLEEWLALERQRPPFQVLASELRRPLTVGPLTVSGAIDRLDRLADGTLAVTDYKTGHSSTADWFGERPREPQLPLYALYGAGEPVAALVYAQVKRGQCQWRGIAAHDTGLPGIKRLDEAGTEYGSWDELRQHWRQVLEGLAHAFRDGQALVDPRTPDECRNCHLPSLCRIHERDHRAGRLRVEDDGDD